MSDIKLNKKGGFVVKESVRINAFIAALFFFLFLFLILLNDEVVSLWNDKTFFFLSKVMALTLIPSVLAFNNARSRQKYIRINSNGIFYYNTLKTDWSNFIGAQIAEKQITGSFQDHFYLVLHFYKDGLDGIYETCIPLRSTMDKSDEEILAAITHFNNAYHSTLNT